MKFICVALLMSVCIAVVLTANIPLDICSLPHGEVGTCRGKLERWTYHPIVKQCVQFFYGGCGGNHNNFMNQKECEESCTACSLPAAIGRCKKISLRWHYNPETLTCEPFNYGGCGGNANNFQTKVDCLTACTDADIL